MTERFEMTDGELDMVAAGQTREHVLLARQVSVPLSARSGDDDAGHGGVITFDFPSPRTDRGHAMTDPAVALNDETLDHVAAGQTREHVLLSRQVGVPAAAKGDDDDDSGGGLLIRPDGP